MKMVRRYGSSYYPMEKEKEIRKDIEEDVNKWGEYYLEHWKEETFIKKGWKEEKKVCSDGYITKTKYTYEFVTTCKANYSKRQSTTQSYTVVEIKEC